MQIKWNDTYRGIIGIFLVTEYLYVYVHKYHIFIEYVPVGYYYSFARCTSPQGQQTKNKQCTQGFNCVSW